MTDSVICSHSRDGKMPSYSQINTVCTEIVESSPGKLILPYLYFRNRYLLIVICCTIYHKLEVSRKVHISQA